MLKKFLIGTFFAALLFVGTTAFASYDFGPTTLKVGSTGDYVKTLQTLVGATADGAFGPLTKAKVMAWQANNGLVADGLFGNLSKAKANLGLGGTSVTGCEDGAAFNSLTGASCGTSTVAGCAVGALFSSTTGASCSGAAVVVPGVLAGTAGTVTFTQLSQYSSEELGSGQNDVKIAGFELEAADGDVDLKSFKLTLDNTGYAAGDSTRIVDYIDSVSIWQGTTKIGTANTADFTRDSTAVYSKVVAVSGAIVRDGDTEKFYVTADAANNIDSGDINSDSWTVDIINVRYADGSGVVSTDTITLTAIPISFVTAATATDTKLKVSLNSTPIAGVVDIDATNNTDDVVLMKGKLVLEGSSDVWLDALPVTFTAATTSGSINAITGSVKLTLGSNTYTEVTGTTNCLTEADFATASTCSTEAEETAGILFDNLNYTIPAGSTVNFTISADINDLDATVAEATNFDAGDTLLASITTTGRAFIVAENSQGDQLTDATEMTGSAVGEAQAFRDTGINVAFVSSTATISHAGDINNTLDHDQGTFTITFDVTAFGDDMYIDGTKPTDAAADAVMARVSISGSSTDTYVDSNIRSSTGAVLGGTVDANGWYEVLNGTTERFTITYVTAAAADGLFQMSLLSLAYVPTTGATGTTMYNYDMANYLTPSLNMNADL
jgi:peptidoglycan hydrolase-like protein with peptidoglycan-binding domain